MELVYTLLVLLAILNIVLGIGLRNLIKQNEELEDKMQ